MQYALSTTALNSYQDLYSIWESTVGALSDMFKFVTVFAIFHFAFAVGLYGIYVPQVRIPSLSFHITSVLLRVFFASLQDRLFATRALLHKTIGTN